MVANLEVTPFQSYFRFGGHPSRTRNSGADRSTRAFAIMHQLRSSGHEDHYQVSLVRGACVSGPRTTPSLASGARSELFGGSLQTVLRKAGAKTVATKDSSVVGVVFLSERVS